MDFPNLPLGEFGEAGVHWITTHGARPIEAFGAFVEALYGALLSSLSFAPPPVLIVIVAAVAWYTAGRGTALFSLFSLLMLWNQGLWASTMKTVSLTLTSAVLSLLVAIPLGVLIAESRFLQ